MLMQLSCGCCIEPLPSVNIRWTRSQCLVGPLNSNTEVSGYTRSWVFGLPYLMAGMVPLSTIPIWHLKGTSGISATAETVATANPRFVEKMAPIRFRIGDTGWGGFTPTRVRQYLSQDRIETAFTNLSPPAAGHSGAALVTSVIVQPPLATIFSSAQSGVKFARMWVNGVDVSGVVAVNAIASAGGSQVFACGTLTLSISPTVITDDDVIEFDYWYQFSVTRSEGFYNAGNGIDGDPIPVVGAAPESRERIYPNLQFRSTFNSLNAQRKRRSGDKYRLTFSSNGPGGVTDLTLEPQTDWSFQQTTATMIQMTKTAGTGTGNRVWFDWGKEIPEIIVNKQITSPVVAMFMRYLPSSSGHYGQIDGASTPGVWNPQGTTSFSVRGVEKPNGRGGTGYFDSSSYPSSYFSSYPTSITVEKV